jgi:outer membrane immunogenic protein
MDRWLVYATGGLAVAHINSSLNLQYATGSYNGSDSRTRAGYTVGGGVEYSFAQNWSAKLEYLYLDFGTYTFISPNSNDPLADWATSVRAREHVVRVGLNYKIY